MANAVKVISSINSGSIPGGGAWELWKVFDAEPVNAAADVESVLDPSAVGWELGQFRSFGMWIQLAGSTPNVIVKVLQSWDNTAANYILPDSGGTIVTLTDTNIHVVTITPTPMLFWRFQLDGQAGSGADVTATAYVWAQT